MTLSFYSPSQKGVQSNAFYFNRAIHKANFLEVVEKISKSLFKTILNYLSLTNFATQYLITSLT